MNGTAGIPVVHGGEDVNDDPYAAARASAERLTALAGPHDAAVVLGSGWTPAADAIGAAKTEIPLAGPAPPGGRFADLTDLYSPRLRALARDADPSLAEGVYAMMPGPHYETPAEITMLGRLGADLVGMSTGLEAIAARHLGAEVLGISLVTNLAAGLAGQSLSHAEVVEAGQASASRMGALLAAILPRV